MVRQYDYGANARYYDLMDGSMPQYYQISRELRKRLRHAGNKALDMACGTGNFTSALMRAGYTIEGSDLSLPMLKIARKKNPGLLFYHADMASKPKGSYDVIFCMFNAIGHLDKSKFERMLNNAASCSKILVFDIFNLEFMKKNFISHEFVDAVRSSEDFKALRTSHNTLDVKDGVMGIRWFTIMQENGSPVKRIKSSWQMKIYSAGQLRKMLLKAGFKKVTLLGHFKDGKFGTFDRQKSLSIYAIAEK